MLDASKSKSAHVVNTSCCKERARCAASRARRDGRGHASVSTAAAARSASTSDIRRGAGGGIDIDVVDDVAGGAKRRTTPPRQSVHRQRPSLTDRKNGTRARLLRADDAASGATASSKYLCADCRAASAAALATIVVRGFAKFVNDIHQ